MRIYAAILAGLLVSGCALFDGADAQRSGPNPALTQTSWIVGVEGTAIGRATFTETGHGVLIRLEFSNHGLSAGWRGAHIHQIGDCSDFASGFQASGVHEGHSAEVQHGHLSATGPEAGDLPNIFTPPNGVPFGAEFLAHGVTLSDIPRDGRLPLRDQNGAALIIHANQDDHTSQPIGGAGPRVACAAISR